jgi:hypothetical protein
VITSIYCSALHEMDNLKAYEVEMCHTDQPTAILPLPLAVPGTGYGSFSCGRVHSFSLALVKSTYDKNLRVTPKNRA